MFPWVDLSEVLACWSGNPWMNYSYSACNFKGRGQGDLSHHHTSHGLHSGSQVFHVGTSQGLLSTLTGLGLGPKMIRPSPWTWGLLHGGSGPQVFPWLWSFPNDYILFWLSVLMFFLKADFYSSLFILFAISWFRIAFNQGTHDLDSLFQVINRFWIEKEEGRLKTSFFYWVITYNKMHGI